MEQNLDDVEEGKRGLGQDPTRASTDRSKSGSARQKEHARGQTRGLKTDLKCELDGGMMVIKWGRNGEFLGCSNYPKCTNTMEFGRDDQGNITAQEPTAPAVSDEACEKCGKPMVRRRSRFGEFLGCSGYPECDGIKRQSCRTDPYGRQLPGLQGRRVARAPEPARQDLLRLRTLSQVQIRKLG